MPIPAVINAFQKRILPVQKLLFMPKIIIFTASYGGGHKSVSKALETYLKTHSQANVQVIDFMEKFVSGDKFMRMLYKQSTKHLPVAYKLFFNLSDKFFGKTKNEKTLKHYIDKTRDFLKEEKPDLVVSVFPTPGVICSILGKELGFKSATVITDFGAHSQWLHSLTDLYFVASSDLKKDLITKGISSKKIKVTGIPLREAFALPPLNKLEIRKKLNLENRFTVLWMSGEYGLGNIKKICEKLLKLPLQLIVVCGNNKKQLQNVCQLKEKMESSCPGRIIPLGFTEEVHNLMSASDLLIGKAGGITVSEAMAMKLPIVIYRPIPGQEIFNVDHLVNNGAALYAHHKSTVVQKVKFLYEHLARLKEMQKKAGEIGKPNATSDVCKNLLSII